jgi:hypothetical protein
MAVYLKGVTHVYRFKLLEVHKGSSAAPVDSKAIHWREAFAEAALLMDDDAPQLFEPGMGNGRRCFMVYAFP